MQIQQIIALVLIALLVALFTALTWWLLYNTRERKLGRRRQREDDARLNRSMAIMAAADAQKSDK